VQLFELSGVYHHVDTEAHPLAESSPGLEPLLSRDWNSASAAHLLRRVRFAYLPGEVATFASMGPEKAVAQLLEKPTSVKPAPPDEELHAWREARASMREAGRGSSDRAEEARREVQQSASRAMAAMRRWWLRCLCESPPGVEEALTLFWHGHFTSSSQKVRDPSLLWQQHCTFRELGLGDMRELTLAMTRDPALMIYLDLAGSKASAPNENFARELFELFLLGEGNYTEEDIRETARALSGWSVNRMQGTAQFSSRHADLSEKTVFGQRGAWQSEDIVRIAFAQPAASRFLSAKLWAFFAGRPPQPSLAEQLARHLREVEFDTRAFLQTVFLSRAFHDRAVRGQMIKSPVQWLVGTCLHLQVPLPPGRFVELTLREQGQILFAPPNVRGWEGGRSWINTATFRHRQESAGRFLRGFGKSQTSVTINDWAEVSPDSLPVTASGHFLAGDLPAEKSKELENLIDRSRPVTSLSERRAIALKLMQFPEYQLL
jgi:uncharacterized protein (DUF1800 family)